MHARQIAYFLAVVEHGGFGRAAAALRIAQPTLSQSVKALERSLGADLFHRASHGVVLTSAGRALLGPARQLMRDVGAARRSVGSSAPVVVEIVATPPLGVDPGARLIGTFCRAYPEISVQLDKPESDDALPVLVRDATSELGLSYLPVHRLGLVEIELGWHELMLASPPGADPGPGPVPISRLDGVSMIAPPRGCDPRDFVESALRSAGVRTRLVMEMAQRDTILELVAAGVGSTVLTDASLPAASPRGVSLRPFDPPLRRPFGLIHRPGPLSEAASLFLAHACLEARTWPKAR